MNDTQNPGSALGEAIGTSLEIALNSYLTELVEGLGYHFLSRSPQTNRAGINKKLLLYDKFGTAYNIDSVIANESMQPIILIESKYIRYKKHNRDKGSWLCTAHPAIRRRYESIRSSIAVLAGNWSSSSLTMIKSFDINVFLIPFSRICDLLDEFGIDFNWGEKDRESAVASWHTYNLLSNKQKADIGERLIEEIRAVLKTLVISILDESLERNIDKVMIELHSNLGEVKAREFSSIDDAISYLNTDELGYVFITSDAATLFDPPPVVDESDE
ncbi:MAG: hypothetical protein HYZ26_01135 [Chloroflexi bacterium]|nr:hypothetical protein [Chloroflexota bacterium]